MRKLILFLFGIFLLVNLVNAISIGAYKQNKDIILFQTCNNCTYCNLTSLKYPDSSYLFAGPFIEMTKVGTYYFYNLSSVYTSNLGIYKYCYDCGNPDENTVGCIDFEITPTGFELSTSKGILYLVFIIAAMIIFLLSLYGAIKLPFSNARNEEGRIIGMNELKYLKIFLFVVSYISLMFIIGLLRGVTYNYLNDLGVYRFFNWLFWIMFTLMFPIMVVSMFVALTNFIQDKKINEALQRGIRFR